jgi:hypothetical protein
VVIAQHQQIRWKKTLDSLSLRFRGGKGKEARVKWLHCAAHLMVGKIVHFDSGGGGAVAE